MMCLQICSLKNSGQVHVEFKFHDNSLKLYAAQIYELRFVGFDEITADCFEIVKSIKNGEITNSTISKRLQKLYRISNICVYQIRKSQKMSSIFERI